jgi:hypothetical protein
MIIYWSKFAPALFLLLLPIGLFHTKKVRLRPVARDWNDHWAQILTLGLHWIDLGRAALGGWLLVEALAASPGVAGVMRYSVVFTQGIVVLVGIGLQCLVCKEEDGTHAPFTYVTGLLFGLFTPVVAAFPLLLALTITLGMRTPSLYFPLLAVLVAGAGFAFEPKKPMVKLALVCCAVTLPWLIALLFRRDLMISYRAKRTTKETEPARSTS